MQKRASQSIIDENNISAYNNIKDDIFKNIADKILLTDEKENKNIIEQRIKEDELEKNR
ncbi:L-aspartate oxidase [Fusobacterium animalis ATCC 51191]|uniref:L-aspartate oxidase n=1 Tax=Fusobacterium animalis ATCC 51191 TaxID=997347 RepID=F9EJP6_9FUSO|nr:L-aspartate oxidase [Fusobacterium animalis ATCC 51191]